TDGAYIQGTVTGDPLDALQVLVNLESDVRRALTSVGSAGEEVGTTARTLNSLVQGNEQQLERILQTAEQVLLRADSALAKFDTAMDAVNGVLGDEDLNLRLREALQGIPRILEDAGALLVGLQQV